MVFNLGGSGTSYAWLRLCNTPSCLFYWNALILLKYSETPPYPSGREVGLTTNHFHQNYLNILSRSSHSARQRRPQKCRTDLGYNPFKS
ncbi:hypothetical protein LEMLEM_LOCUS12739 [Lemmus lemmus]